MDDSKPNAVDENIYVGKNSIPIDIVKCTKDMYEKDSEWANLAFRVANSDLSEYEMEMTKMWYRLCWSILRIRKVSKGYTLIMKLAHIVQKKQMY
jgi:hypothetical protein